MSTLDAALSKEMERVRNVLELYKSIGPAGNLGGMLIEDTLRRATKIITEGNAVAMLSIYRELKEIE